MAQKHSGFDATGDIQFTGLSSGLPYGQLYAYNVASTITIAGTGIGNKVQITSFTTTGPSNNTTPSAANDDIAIILSGRYLCTVSLSLESVGAGGADLIGIGVFKNNGIIQFQQLHVHRRLAGGGVDTGSISISGILLATAGDTIEVWIWNETSVRNVVIDDINLSLLQIGF